MNIQVYTGIAPDFKPLVTFDFHCCKCGQHMRMPADSFIQRIASEIEEYYQKENQRLHIENRRLREILEFGNQAALIKNMAQAGKI